MDHRAVPGRDQQAGRIFLIACVMAWCQGPVAAADTDALPSVTVTGSRSPESVSRQSNNVTVITAKDIERSTAQDVGTLLATEANLSLLSYAGNDKKASIDMRGMGITAVSNVLILVDGERLTEIDQSGADLSTLSLSQIERIEVIRGGGGVRYGQGAVGGVINITTKRPEAGPLQGDAMLRAGSFNSRAAQAALRGGSDNVAAQVMLSHAKSDGYRQNGGQESNTATLEVRRLPQSSQGLVDLFARASLHEDTYGLPGPISQQAFHGDDRSRRSSASPLDGGSTQDYRLTVGGAYDWGAAGRMSLRLSARDRSNPYIFGATSLDQEEARGLVRSEREDAQWRYDLTHESGGQAYSLTLGIDAQNGRYARWDQGVKVEESRLVKGQAQTRSAFVDTNTSPFKGLNIHAGFRQDWFKTSEGHFKYVRPVISYVPFVQGPDIITVMDDAETEVPTRHWRNQSAELGFSWQFAPRWSWFGSLSQHVRYPNLDDLALQAEDLRPQRGRTLEQGWRYTTSTWSGSFTMFAMRIEDEIYYGPEPGRSNSVNRNYDYPTMRRGLEMEARWRPSERWFLRGQWAYVAPKFENAPGNPDIPLVPRSTLSGELGWDVQPNLLWTVQATHASQRLDGDALANRSLNLPILKDYTVMNTVWRLHQKSWQLSLGITNLLDEVYTNQANSGNAYPMPGRAAYVEWRTSY